MWSLSRALGDKAGTLAAVQLSSVQFILTKVNILRSNIDLVKEVGKVLMAVYSRAFLMLTCAYPFLKYEIKRLPLVTIENVHAANTHMLNNVTVKGEGVKITDPH